MGERPVHYGCLEFGEDAERVIQGRAHPKLAHLYHEHLAFCGDCQRVHHRLEALYRKPKAPPPLDSFSRDHEFEAIMARTKGGSRRGRERMSSATSLALVTSIAALLALTLLFPSLGARLFRAPEVAAVVDCPKA